MYDKLEDILERKGKIRRVGVVGMGYVGIPSAALFANSPDIDMVYGFQRNSGSSGYKIEMLNHGECPIKGEELNFTSLL